MSLRDVEACGAKTRFGTRWGQPGMRPSGRCRMHGGKTPRGIANPNTKTGRYCQDAPTHLFARYEDLMADGTRLPLRDDIAPATAAQRIWTPMRHQHADHAWTPHCGRRCAPTMSRWHRKRWCRR